MPSEKVASALDPDLTVWNTVRKIRNTTTRMYEASSDRTGGYEIDPRAKTMYIRVKIAKDIRKTGVYMRNAMNQHTAETRSKAAVNE